MHVIAEINTHDGRSWIATASSIRELRENLATAREKGEVTADIWRWPGKDYPVIDAPTWRIIRTPEQFIRSESFSPGS